jgi:hypothetical protein
MWTSWLLLEVVVAVGCLLAAVALAAIVNLLANHCE